jgi:hypothetical protein
VNKAYLNTILAPDLKRIKDDLRYHRGVIERLEEQKKIAQEDRNRINPQDSIYLAQQKAGETVRWVVSNNDGHLEIKPETVPAGDNVSLSSYDGGEESLDLPAYLRVVGHKIDLRGQVEKFKESYMKNYIQTRSHNLIVARFSEFKVSVLGWILSLVGVQSLELQRLQKKAVEGAIRENKILFEENEYNAELITIVGGNSKQAKAQLRVTAEIRKQIIAQCDRMGLKDYFTEDRVAEVRLKQCRAIYTRFREEEMKLEYQLAYC